MLIGKEKSKVNKEELQKKTKKLTKISSKVYKRKANS
jgi:hypothetical protein